MFGKLELEIPYSGKLLREKNFANFMDLGLSVKGFSAKRGMAQNGFVAYACTLLRIRFTARS